MSLTGEYKGVATTWAHYWRTYGGPSALATSPYFHLAFVLTAMSFGKWCYRNWWDTVIDVLPNVLGFTLGGYAILVGFGDDKFRKLLIARPSTKVSNSANESPYMRVSATFVHFLAVQTSALIVALLASSLEEGLKPCRVETTGVEPVRALELALSFGGYLLFMYSLTLVLAATLHVFRMGKWYDQRVRAELERQQHEKAVAATEPISEPKRPQV